MAALQPVALSATHPETRVFVLVVLAKLLGLEGYLRVGPWLVRTAAGARAPSHLVRRARLYEPAGTRSPSSQLAR